MRRRKTRAISNHWGTSLTKTAATEEPKSAGSANDAERADAVKNVERAVKEKAAKGEGEGAEEAAENEDAAERNVKMMNNS